MIFYENPNRRTQKESYSVVPISSSRLHLYTLVPVVSGISGVSASIYIWWGSGDVALGNELIF